MKRTGAFVLRIWFALLFVGFATACTSSGSASPADGDPDERPEAETQENEAPLDGDSLETQEQEAEHGEEEPAEEACEGPRSLQYYVNNCGSENEVRDSSCHRYTYDTQGRVLSDYYYEDCGAADWRNYCAFTTYAADGEKLAVRFDWGCDGIPDCYLVNDPQKRTIFRKGYVESCYSAEGGYPCSVYTYDEHGNILSEMSDFDCTGIFYSYCTRMTYDEHDRLTSQKSDENCDGIFERDCYTYTYDEHGNLLREEDDYECTGEIHARCQIHSYDARGNWLTQAYDDNCDGLPDSGCTSFTYDESGRVLTEKHEYNCNPHEAYCVIHSYDAGGRLLSTGDDADCDGKMDHGCQIYTYDAGGRQVREKWDFNCDGADVTCYEMDYACFPP